MKRKIRVGFIGAGWWATTNTMPILKARDDVTFVGVASLGRDILEKVQTEFGFQMVTESVDELLAQDLDGVIISSPHNLHAEHALAVLSAGCHALVEKPFSLTAKDARAVVSAAQKADRHVLVPYGWNYMPFLETAHELMAEGGVGQIEYVLCHMASPTLGLFTGGGAVFDQWKPSVVDADVSTWQDPNAGGGYAHGQITHSSALMFWLTGLRPAKVNSCLMHNADAAIDLYDSATILFEGGALGTISGAATLPDNEPFQLDIRIFGSEGVLLVDVERERVELRRRDGAHVSVPVERGAGAYVCHEPPMRFIDLIKGDGINNSDAEIAARTSELLEALHIANATGRPVQIREVKG
jgi:predicted dehydrogenase